MHSVYIAEEVRASQRLFADILQQRLDGSVYDLLSAQALRLHEAHGRRDPAVIAHLTCWCPGLVGRAAATLDAELSLELARETMAREHGYQDWAQIQREGRVLFDPLFEHAVDCVVHGELDSLHALLTQRPELVTERSPFAHRATLLHYVGANGVETYRQCTPLNAPEIAILLLDHGARAEASAEMYGGATTLELVVSSAHPRNAGLTEQIAKLLR